MCTPPPIEVAAAIIECNGKFLVTQRVGNQHLAGHWEFPGGKRKHGESWKRCLARELCEELGIAVRVGKRAQLIEHHYPEKSVRIAFYRCTIMGGIIHPHEGQPVRWATRAQLRKMRFPAADVAVIQKLAGTRAAL